MSADPSVLLPDPGTARDWLREELARREYQESLLDRFARWFNDLVDGIRSATSGLGGLDPVAATVVLVLLVAGLAVVLSRLGRNVAVPEVRKAVFTEPPLEARQHRRSAQQALDQGRWDEAVVESVRALAAGLVERGLVPEQTDVTVHELTDRSGALFHDLRERLVETGRAFDETRYGDRPADRRRATAAVDLELEVSRTPPTSVTAHGVVTAVPR